MINFMSPRLRLITLYFYFIDTFRYLRIELLSFNYQAVFCAKYFFFEFHIINPYGKKETGESIVEI